MTFWKMVAAAAVLAIAYYAWQSRPYISAAARESIIRQCVEWIGDEFAGDDETARAAGDWNKHGRVVVQVALTEVSRPDYSSLLLCVVNPASGQMLKPSAFDQTFMRF